MQSKELDLKTLSKIAKDLANKAHNLHKVLSKPDECFEALVAIVMSAAIQNAAYGYTSVCKYLFGSYYINVPDIANKLREHFTKAGFTTTVTVEELEFPESYDPELKKIYPPHKQLRVRLEW